MPALRLPLDEILRGEFHENVHRKDFTDAGRLAITEALAERERAAAKARAKDGAGRPPKMGGKLPPNSRGKTRDHVARATGVGARTAGKLLAETAQRPDMQREVCQFQMMSVKRFSKG